MKVHIYPVDYGAAERMARAKVLELNEPVLIVRQGNMTYWIVEESYYTQPRYTTQYDRNRVVVARFAPGEDACPGCGRVL